VRKAQTEYSGTGEMFIDYLEYTDIFNLLGRITRIEAVVNAANTNVTFGGGISGAIGTATGEADNINQEARKHIDEFNKIIGTRNNALNEAETNLRRALNNARLVNNDTATHEQIWAAVEALCNFYEDSRTNLNSVKAQAWRRIGDELLLRELLLKCDPEKLTDADFA